MADPIARPEDRLVPAILIFLLAMILFDGMGLIIKRLSPYYSAAELSAWRNLFGLLPGAIILLTLRAWHREGRPLRMRQWRLAAFRGLCVTFAQFSFYFALGAIPFATANTIAQSNALFMTALAVPFLGEKVGWLRWGAVGIGFVGVMLILKPGASEALTFGALAPLCSGFLYALAGVLSRKLDPDVPSPLVNIYSTGTALICSGILALALGGFTPIRSMEDLAWIVAMGAFGGLAVLCLIIAFRMTEQSNLAPISYASIPTSLILGWLFFAEAPIDDLFPGALLIILGGLIVVWRERQLRARAA